MKKMHNKTIGDYGEELAVRFLQARGYIIIDQNFSSRYGEIDIIALTPEDKEMICCIEVKTRETDNFGTPEEAITRTKLKRLHDTACSYFFQKRIENKFFRLDAISILLSRQTQTARIKHLKAISYT